MARFSVYRLKSGAMVIDCQADVLSDLPTRFTVPLVEPSRFSRPVARLHPLLAVGEERRVMVTTEASAILVSEIAHEIAKLSDDDMVIANALDMLLTGF